MKSVVILSGKGGVGKSSITASLALIFSKDSKVVCADCDVDASNLSLLFGLYISNYAEWKSLSTNQAAVVDKNKCIGCKKCIDSCYFNALSWKSNNPELNKYGCEGCGVCELICPTKAISLKNIDNAFVGYAKTNKGFFIASAQLEPGNSGSGKVVFEVKKKAKQLLPEADLFIVDAAAGIGCPVIASVTGSDYAILVTEPTPSAYSDMQRALEIVNHFKMKKGIIINKYDINKEMTTQIEQFAKINNIRILAKIPFDKSFVKAMTAMIPIIEFEPKYEKIFEEIKAGIIEGLK